MYSQPPSSLENRFSRICSLIHQQTHPIQFFNLLLSLRHTKCTPYTISKRERERDFQHFHIFITSSCSFWKFEWRIKIITHRIIEKREIKKKTSTFRKISIFFQNKRVTSITNTKFSYRYLNHIFRIIVREVNHNFKEILKRIQRKYR